MCDREQIIAVDFDGCLCENAWPDIGWPRRDVIDALLLRQKQGAKIILWTCRVGERLDAAVKWCADRGIVFDAINENLPVNVAAFGNDCRKIYADEYWDDKAVPISANTSVFNFIPIHPGEFKSLLYAWDKDNVYGHTPVVPTNRIAVNPRYFVALREFARMIANGTEWDKKARIVLEYDPDAPKMEIKTFMQRDEASPPAATDVNKDNDPQAVLRDAKFLLEPDVQQKKLTIYPAIENEPICLTEKEAMALAAMIKEQTQSWSER